MTSIYSNKIPVATAMAFALGASAAQPALSQMTQTQAGVDRQQSSAIQAGPVTIQFGGFAELAGIYRNRNEVSDVASDFNTGIPSNFDPLSQEDEFRESARQSRFSMLVQGAPYDHAKAELYFESDFLSAAATSNSRESNSYAFRIRHFYGRFQTDYGLDVLAGQNWSLATMYKQGLSPRDEQIPMTIDAQYVVGFNWTRNPQLRIVEHLNKVLSVGISAESPQAVTSGANSPPSNVIANTNNPGDSAGLLNNTTTYSTDSRPDVILKVAADPGYGHYEVYGLARWFTDNVTTLDTTTATPTFLGRSNQTATGGGVGFGVELPLAPDILSFQVSGLVGKGIGRYGSGQMTDFAVKPDGSLEPIRAYQFLTGLVLTPNPRHTFYVYAGREQSERTIFNSGTTIIGYGSPLADNSGCYAPLTTAVAATPATVATCAGNTQKLEEVTAGYWWKFYQGVLGNAQIGLQGAYVQRDLFPGNGGTTAATGVGANTTPGFAPVSNVFIGMVSFRYYPYQR